MDNQKFLNAYNDTMSHEGAYCNTPADKGGETYKGIARNFWPNWEGWDIIDDYKKRVSRNQLNNILNNDTELTFYVEDFYYKMFWEPLQLNQFDQRLASELFDTAVNQGRKTAVIYLQAGLNMLNNNQKHFSDISEDGIIGKQTIKAYNNYLFTANFPGRSVLKNISTLLKAINGLQFAKYRSIVKQDPKQEIFFYGWLNRV